MPKTIVARHAWCCTIECRPSPDCSVHESDNEESIAAFDNESEHEITNLVFEGESAIAETAEI